MTATLTSRVCSSTDIPVRDTFLLLNPGNKGRGRVGPLQLGFLLGLSR